MTSPAQPAPNPVEELARVVIATVTAVVEAVVGRRVLGVARTAAGPFLGVAGWATSGVRQRLAASRPTVLAAWSSWLDDALPAVVESVADRVLARVDVDRLLRMVVARIDVDALALEVLDKLDLDQLAEVALDRVELEKVVARALDQLDLTSVVLERVDIARVVEKALDGLDLTSIIVDRVDLDRVVDTALDGLDLDAVVRTRVDLLGLAEYVVDGIDLPGIVRDSTGTMASEVVQGVRLQSVDADAAVARLMERLLLRRRQREAIESLPTQEPEE